MFLWRAALALVFGAPADWTSILLVRRRDDDSPVYSQTYFANPGGAFAGSGSIQRDLDGMTLNSVCEKYGIEYETRSNQS